MLVALGWDFTQEAKLRIRAGETTLKAVIWIFDMFLVMLIANITIYMGPCRMENLIQVLNQLQQVLGYHNLMLKQFSRLHAVLLPGAIKCRILSFLSSWFSDKH